jgi:hypothetical protein
MSRSHMASCGMVGATGRRIGTGYAHTPEQCWEIMGKPWFRFRNDAARDQFFAWQAEMSARTASAVGTSRKASEPLTTPDVNHNTTEQA